MPALESGTKAPAVKLPLVSAGTFDLAEALKRGPVALAFFKISCPVCQMTLPYLERLHQAYPGSKLQVVGVSQDSKGDTQSFMKEFGVTFPIALDDTSKYPVSNAFGLTNVPTIFLITPDGKIQMSGVGWAKNDIETLNTKMAQADGKQALPPFKPGEQVQDFRAG
jgi:peroxiredoxin